MILLSKCERNLRKYVHIIDIEDFKFPYPLEVLRGVSLESRGLCKLAISCCARVLKPIKYTYTV